MKVQGIANLGNSATEGSRQNRRGNKSELKDRRGRPLYEESRPSNRQNFIKNNEDREQLQHTRSREAPSQIRDELFREASEEESYRNHRSQSNGRHVFTFQGNRSGYLTGLSRKDATTALPSTTEMRKTHGGFYKPQERSRDRIPGDYPERDDRDNENSFETEEIKFSGRGIQRESRTAYKEKRKLPVIRIVDRHNQSRKNLPRASEHDLRDYARGRFDDEEGSGREDFTQRNEEEADDLLYKSRSGFQLT